MIDCVLVGYNELSFEAMVEQRRASAGRNGYYSYLKTNSVLLDGKRLDYTELLNRVRARAQGRTSELNVFNLPNLAVCYLTSYLRRRELDVETVNFFNHDKSALADHLRRGVRAVAITTTFYVEPTPIIEIVEFVRAHSPDTLVVVGGPHIFNICKANEVEGQDYIFESIGADIYIHDSQGEHTLAALLHELRSGRDLSRIDNLIYRRELAAGGASGTRSPSRSLQVIADDVSSDRFARTARVPENNDMNECSIDWSVIDRSLYLPAAQTRTARSCAYKCSFCTFPEMAGPLTLTDIDVVERELRYLASVGVEYVTFIDDTFNVPLPRFKKLLRMMIKNDLGIRWFSHFRPANADAETFALMRDSGCMAVFLGIESGDQRVLDNMNKRARVQRYAEGIANLHKHDILSFCSFIIGFPGETAESIENTVRFINDTAPTYYQASLYYHYDQTPIGRRRKEFGIQSSGYSWKHDTMHWREAADAVEALCSRAAHSRLLPLFGFDFFGIPYFLGKGLTINQFTEFLALAQKMIVASLPDEPVDLSGIEAEMIALLAS